MKIELSRVSPYCTYFAALLLLLPGCKDESPQSYRSQTTAVGSENTEPDEGEVVTLSDVQAEGSGIDLLGRSSTFGEGLGTQYANLVTEQDIDAIADVGFKLFRYFAFDVMNPDFARGDRLMKKMLARGITPVAIIGSDSVNTLPMNPQTWDALGQAAAKVAQRYAGQRIIWELFNEPNHAPFWANPNPVFYAEIAVRMAAAIRAVAPGHAITGPSVAVGNPNFKSFCTAVFKQRPDLFNYFDAASIHAYTRTGKEGPESLPGALGSARDLLGKFRPGFPLFMSEWGWAVGGGAALSATQHAAFSVQLLLSHYTNGLTGTILYQWKDESFNGGSDTKGLMTHDGKPRRAFFEVKKVFDELKGYTFAKKGGATANVLVFQRGGDGAFKIAAWAPGASTITIKGKGTNKATMKVGPLPSYKPLPPGFF